MSDDKEWEQNNTIECLHRDVTSMEQSRQRQEITLAALRSRLKEAEGLLRVIEWDGSARANSLVCPFCGAGSYPMHGGRKHRAECELGAFLAGSTQGTPADSNGGGR